MEDGTEEDRGGGVDADLVLDLGSGVLDRK